MKETNAVIEEAPSGSAEVRETLDVRDVIMKTAFYCNQDYYTVSDW